VHAVKVNNIPSTFLLSDPIGSITSLAPSSRGLEVLTIVANGASLANICELTIDIPSSIIEKCAISVLVRKINVEISYSINESFGSLIFAPSETLTKQSTRKRQRVAELVLKEKDGFDDSTVMYAVTKLKPDLAGTISGNGLGPRCIFPCADVLSINTTDQGYIGTFFLAFTILGADSFGMLTSRSTMKPVKIEVVGSGDSLETDIVPCFNCNATSPMRTKRWRFAVKEPTRPSSIGFAAGPLTPFSSVDVRLVVSSVTSTTSSLFSPPSTQRTSSGASSSSETATHVNIEHFVPQNLLQSGSAITHHSRRTRRMLVWLSEWLRARYPFSNHRYVFLPSCVLEASASILVTPTGLLPMLSEGSDYLHGDSCSDTYCMAGLTLLPDSLLTSNRVFDPDIACHTAQAFGIASTWIGCTLRASAWQDAWLLQGLVRYVVAVYLRSFRGEADFSLWLERLCESTARLEDEFPSLHPIYPDMVDTASVDNPSLCANSPLSVNHPLRSQHVAVKAPAVCNIFAAHVGEMRFRNAISAIVVKSLALNPDVAVNPQQALSDRIGHIRLSASTAGHCGFLSTNSFLSCMKICGGGGDRSVDVIDSLAKKWIFGRGIPTFIIGVQYQSDSNRINLTIEQVMRPGSEFFRGELPIVVYERSEAGASSPPDAWQHTVIISRVRDTFSLPCHTRTQRIVGDYWGDTSIRLGKKRGRLGKKKASESAASVQSGLVAEGVSTLDALDADDINRSPIEWIRIDPNRCWLRRIHVSLPPCMTNSQLCRDPSVASQIEAMRSMAELLCGDALAVPGGGYLPMPSAGAAFPTVEEPPLSAQDATSPEVDILLRSDTAIAQQRSLATALSRLGYHPRPVNLKKPIFQFVSLILGLDLAIIKLRGSGQNFNIDNISFKPTTHWRLRVAAATNFARWQSGRLPGYGKIANSSTHQQTFVGLAALIALYQRFYYVTPASGSISQGTANVVSETTILNLIDSLTSTCTSEESLLKFATSGIPNEIIFTSIEGFQVQRGLLRAIGSIRHPDGFAPDAAIAFLAYNLRTYDSHKVSIYFDDSSLLTDLIRSLGSCMIASDGARRIVRILRQNARELVRDSTLDRRPTCMENTSTDAFNSYLPFDSTGTLDFISVKIYKEAWAILREQLAIELLSLKHSSRDSRFRDSVTQGTCAAVCLSVLSILETRFAAPPIAATPILCSYLDVFHASGQFFIPSRLRIAAFSALSRIVLLSIPFYQENEPLITELFLSTNWSKHVELLLETAATPAILENNETLSQIMILTLYILQSRTDLDADDVRISNEEMNDVGFCGSASISNAGDKIVIDRLRYDLRRAMLDERDTDADVRAILDSETDTSIFPKKQATTFITRWTFTEAAVDLGLNDLQQTGDIAMSMQERRLYGSLRLAPSFRGCLGPIARKVYQNCIVLEQMWRILEKSMKSSNSFLFQSTYHLIHSIFGLLPPLSAVKLSNNSLEFSKEKDKFTDLRRNAIQILRERARNAHLHVALSYAQGKALQQQTSTAPRALAEADEEAEDDDEDDDVKNAVSLEENDINHSSDGNLSNDESVPESMLVNS
jgi:hypothetical protein